MKMEKGSKTTSSSCVAEADTKKPQPALFAPEGLKCDYRDDYIRGGKINATLGCTGAGLNGDVSTLVNGSYTGRYDRSHGDHGNEAPRRRRREGGDEADGAPHRRLHADAGQELAAAR
jgi:hypothetical protein